MDDFFFCLYSYPDKLHGHILWKTEKGSESASPFRQVVTSVQSLSWTRLPFGLRGAGATCLQKTTLPSALFFFFKVDEITSLNSFYGRCEDLQEIIFDVYIL